MCIAQPALNPLSFNSLKVILKESVWGPLNDVTEFPYNKYAVENFRIQKSWFRKGEKKMLKLWTAIIFLCFYNCITLYGMEDREIDDEDYLDDEETVAKGLVSS